MIGYTFKVYLSRNKEHFAFGETEIAPSPLTEKDFPFAESLLRLLDLNIWEYEPLIKDMEQALLRFYRTKEQQDSEIILTGLDQLAAVHIYFELLRLDWKFWLERAEKAEGHAIRNQFFGSFKMCCWIQMVLKSRFQTGWPHITTVRVQTHSTRFSSRHFR